MNFEIILSYLDWYNKDDYEICKTEFEYIIMKKNQIVFVYNSQTKLIHNYIKNYSKIINKQTDLPLIKITNGIKHKYFDHANYNLWDKYKFLYCIYRGVSKNKLPCSALDDSGNVILLLLPIVEYNFDLIYTFMKYTTRRKFIDNKYESIYYSNFFHLI